MEDFQELKKIMLKIIEENNGKFKSIDIINELKRLKITSDYYNIGKALWDPENNIKTVKIVYGKYYATEDYIEKPSQHNEQPWIYSRPKSDKITMGSKKKSGKWLVFRKSDQIDEAWQIVSVANKKGILGTSCKVSTQFSNKSKDANFIHVICIYTQDAEFEDDILEVGHKIKLLFPNDKIFYKTDEDTKKGKYRKNGDRNISKYQL
ncbi:MAG: DUF1917 domain-containing protein [Flavobacteriales bacterium]|nr:DUF1917 domain-containing protein [Flavobacteriales bacterium]